MKYFLLVLRNHTMRKYCKEIRDYKTDFYDDRFYHDMKSTILDYVWIIHCIY